MNKTGVELLHSLSDWIWEASWQGALLAVVVMVVQWALRDRLPARWLNALWLLVLVRLLLPALPESPISVYRWLKPRPPLVIGVYSRDHANGANHPLVASGTDPIVVELPGTAQALASARASWTVWRSAREALPIIWLVLCVAMFGRTILIHRRWMAKVIARRRVAPDVVQTAFAAAKSQLRVARAELIVTTGVTTPMVSGLWRAKVVLPAGLERRLSLEELRMVLWHELGHVKRGDTWLAWLCGLVASLHWFNPVVHLALARARQDREVACDEWVLSHGRDARIYGAALVRILELDLAPGDAVASGAVGICETRAVLFSRVRRIAAYQQPNWLGAIGGSVIVAVLGLCALTSSGDEKPHQTVEGGSLSSGSEALMDYYEREAGVRVRGNGMLRPLEGRIARRDDSDVELTNERFKFGLQQIPKSVRQGTGGFAPVPAVLFEAIDGRSPARVRAFLRTIALPNLPEDDVRNLFEPIDCAIHALILYPEDPKLREIVEILLEFGANPGSPRIDRRSLLFAPVKDGQVGLVSFLLSVGIDPRKTGDGGAAVLQEAELHGSPAMKELIQKAYAKSPDAYGASKLW